MKNTYPFELVWMTTQEHGTPHAEALRASNPELVTHVSAPAAGSAGAGYAMGWRNCDRNIRNWWLRNRGDVVADQVVFCEYDVMVSRDLRDAIAPLKDGCGLAAPRIMTPVRDLRTFWPFHEITWLPREMRDLAVGAAPLAFLLCSRAAMDAVCDPRYDDVFSHDIFCELRLPTVVRHAGLEVAELPLPDVHVRRQTPPPGSRGIFHPVKA